MDMELWCELAIVWGDLACDDTLDAWRELEHDKERGGTDEEPAAGMTDCDKELSVWYLRKSHHWFWSIWMHFQQ